MKKTKMTCPMCKYYLNYDEELGSYVCTNCNFSFKTRAEQTEAEPDKDLSGNGDNIIIPHIADGDEPEETEEKAEEETATVSEDTLETAEETVGEDPDEAKGSLDVYVLDSDLLPEPEDGDAYISSDAFPDEPLPDEADEPEFVPAPPIQRPGSAAIGNYDIERPDYSNLTAPAHAEEPPAYSRTESAPVRPEPRRDDSGSNKKAITIGIIAGIACFLVAGIVFKAKDYDGTYRATLDCTDIFTDSMGMDADLEGTIEVEFILTLEKGEYEMTINSDKFEEDFTTYMSNNMDAILKAAFGTDDEDEIAEYAVYMGYEDYDSLKAGMLDEMMASVDFDDLDEASDEGKYSVKGDTIVFESSEGGDDTEGTVKDDTITIEWEDEDFGDMELNFELEK